MSDILCTACGRVGPPAAGACPNCRSADVLPADSPLARRFIERRAARNDAAATDGPSARAQATGKVLGRVLGRLIGK